MIYLSANTQSQEADTGRPNTCANHRLITLILLWSSGDRTYSSPRKAGFPTTVFFAARDPCCLNFSAGHVRPSPYLQTSLMAVSYPDNVAGYPRNSWAVVVPYFQVPNYPISNRPSLMMASKTHRDKGNGRMSSFTKASFLLWIRDCLTKFKACIRWGLIL
jgi:hypothetical protein